MGANSHRRGNGVTLREALGGYSYSAEPSATWLPPWHVRPSWQASSERWTCTIKPGFVNGRAPIWRTTVQEQAQDNREYESNPLNGLPFFSSFVFGEEEKPTGETRQVEIPLYLGPAIPLVWRPLGYDGSATARVPDFFLRKGAANSPLAGIGDDANSLSVLGVDTSKLTDGPPANLRLLRTCDLWLHQPRPALTSSVSIEPGLATGISNVTQQLGLKAPLQGDTLRILVGDFDALLTAQMNPLAGDYEEPTWDELVIATVYLLSPPDTAPYSEPDSTWTPYVRHRLFWNLNYQQAYFRPIPTGDPSVPFIPPLAGGAAQPLINFLTASLNDATQNALNVLSAHSMAGQFWTPTGGGSSALFPAKPEPPPQGETGLDKDGRLRAQAIAKARTVSTEKLDPDYPYLAVPFVPSLLIP